MAIKINERFSFERDAQGWTLREKKKKTDKLRYFGRLSHLCDRVIDLSAGSCSFCEEVLPAIEKASADCIAAMGGEIVWSEVQPDSPPEE